MSWLFGIVGSNITPDVVSRIKKFLPTTLYIYRTKDMHIFGGGLRETCLSSLDNAEKNKKSRGWIVCGIGISPECDERKHILTSHDWDNIFQQSEPGLDSLEGHFVALCWESNGIKGFVDSRGIRDLYIAQSNRSIIFSTRLDWFAKFGLRCTVDFSRFGSRWLVFNQLSRKSVLRPIDRLGPGAKVSIKHNQYSIHCSEHLYLPRTEKSLEEIISLLSTFPLKAGYRIVNCLSGGVDSRVLLSTLISTPPNQWEICIFGSPHHPDVRIARSIIRDLNLNFVYFADEIPAESLAIRRMCDYVVHTQCIAPATDAIRLGFYDRLYQQKNVVIDGAFGEIMRRSYFNRLFIRGRNALKSGSAKDIASYLRVSRADIFNSDVVNIMQRGLQDDISHLWHKIFGSSTTGNKENCLDLMAIYTRLSNFLGPEVSRLDHLVLNYMPFAQSSFLAATLRSDLHLRRNSSFSKAFIRKYKYTLTKYSLVKNNDTYPFALSHPVLIKFWRELRRLLGFSYQDTLKIDIIKTIEAFIRDTASSRNTRSYAPYNMTAIDGMINNFFAGHYRYAEDLSWWLSFELWRQACQFS